MDGVSIRPTLDRRKFEGLPEVFDKCGRSPIYILRMSGADANLDAGRRPNDGGDRGRSVHVAIIRASTAPRLIVWLHQRRGATDVVAKDVIKSTREMSTCAEWACPDFSDSKAGII